MSIHSADAPFRRGAHTEPFREGRVGNPAFALSELTRETNAQKEILNNFENADVKSGDWTSRKKSLFSVNPGIHPPLQPSAHNRWGLLFPGEKVFATLVILAFVMTSLFLGGLAFIKQSEVALFGAIIIAILAVWWWISVILRVDSQSHVSFDE